ncbi:alkaline phosphatase D family protein [Undibacterium luofuense]|uniref:alkaline phosphatase D family protein n=1 Tax=Undibacterium luofuense TaxID=2828733 RepID=UPI0030EF741D
MASRRVFMQRLLQLSSLAALSHAFPGYAAEKSQAYPFTLGVASGSPRSDSVILWTRLLADALSTTPLAAVPLKVLWEIAEDEQFRQIVNKGEVTALPELAHSVHVEATGLKPGRWYWYRFMHGDAVSPAGRTRTTPEADSMATCKVALASCQHWEFGEFAAHRHIAGTHPDLIVFNGDYIYEWGPYDLKHPAQPRRRDIESFTLSEYRARYAQYKSDPHLQAAHLAAPWLVTWDDHEIANDYANDRDERLDLRFIERRAAAYQAFYEHMPVRLHQAIPKGNEFAALRIYDRCDWGRLIRFHILDARQYRSYQACTPHQRGGSAMISPGNCSDLRDPTRTMLGYEQEQWLSRGLAKSTARWNTVVQQTLMAQCRRQNVVNPANNTSDFKVWTDGWDGYPLARQRLLQSLQSSKAQNPVIWSGDVHTFYAASLRADFNKSVSVENPVLASEYCVTSVTSNSMPQEETDQLVAHNPHLHFGRSDARGFIVADFSENRMQVQMMALQDVSKADSGVSVLKTFITEDGKPGVIAA